MAAASARRGSSTSDAQAAQWVPTRASSRSWSMSTVLWRITWKVAMGRPKATRSAAYSTASAWAFSIEPMSSAHSATALSSATRCQMAVWSPSGPTGSAGWPSSSSRAILRVGSRPGTGVSGALGQGRAVSTRKVPSPSWVRAGTRIQSAVWPSTTVALVPVSVHRPLLRLARVRMRSTTSPWPGLVDGDRAPGGAGGRATRRRSSSPSRRAASVGLHRRREERPDERRPAHLLHHHHEVDHAEAQPAGLLGDEQAGPPQVDDLVPHVVGRSPARRRAAAATATAGTTGRARRAPRRAARPGRRRR